MRKVRSSHIYSEHIRVYVYAYTHAFIDHLGHAEGGNPRLDAIRVEERVPAACRGRGSVQVMWFRA